MQLLKISFCIWLVFATRGEVVAQRHNLVQHQQEFELEYIPLMEDRMIENINAMREDREGNLWMSSFTGLLYFDGRKVYAYSNDSPRFKESELAGCKNLNISPGGNLFLIKGDKLIGFDPLSRKCNFVSPYSLLTTPRQINWLMHSFDEDKHLVLRTGALLPDSLFICSKEKMDFFVSPDWKENDESYILAICTGKDIFIANNNYFYRYDLSGNLVVKIRLPESISCGIMHKNHFYFGSAGKNRIYEFDPSTNRFQVLYQYQFPYKPTNIFVDDDIILLTTNNQLTVINRHNHTIQEYSDDLLDLIKEKLSHNKNNSGVRVFKSRNGQRYLYLSSLLLRLKEKMPSISKYRERVITSDGAPAQSFREFASDEQGNLYVSYYTGLAKKSKNQQEFKSMPVKIDVMPNHEGTYSLIRYNKSLVWNNVQVQLPGLGWKYILDNHYWGQTTNYLEGDTLWLYPWHLKKMFVVHMPTQRLVRTIDFTNSDFGTINNIIAHDDGFHLWFSSQNAIYLMHRSGSIVRKIVNQAGYNPTIVWLHKEGNKLWFAAEGIGCVDLKTFNVKMVKNTRTLNNGVISNPFVYSILPYRDSFFILGTGSGIAKFNKYTFTFANLENGHPLSNQEFNRNSTWISSNGKYYLGSVEGLYSFYPDELEFKSRKQSFKPLKLINIGKYSHKLKDNLYQHQDLDQIKEIVLTPQESNLDLLFSHVDENNAAFYTYRIVGYNNSWSEKSTSSRVFINSLPPGSYTLEVKTTSVAEQDRELYIYRIPIVVEQVWYKTWTFFGILLIFVSCLIYYFFRLQLKRRLVQQQQALNRQKELASLRTKISSDLHDDVGTILTGLAMQSQNLAMFASEDSKLELNEIAEMSKEAMDRMRDTVWVIDSRKDKFVNLLDRMRAFAEQSLSNADIEHQFRVSLKDENHIINPDVRQNIYLIFKELITNIVKHSGATEVNIVMDDSRGYLYLCVEDNGKSAEPQTGDGLGLSNVSMRAKAIGGEVKYAYTPGFKVELVLKNHEHGG